MSILAEIENMRDHVINEFKKTYSWHQKDIHIDKPIHKNVNWRPTFFVKQKYSYIAFEVSDEPIPKIFLLSHVNILQAHIPIIVISICPEENIKPKDIKEMKRYGFARLMVSSLA